jgi:hypothetical protein
MEPFNLALLDEYSDEYLTHHLLLDGTFDVDHIGDEPHSPVHLGMEPEVLILFDFVQWK